MSTTEKTEAPVTVDDAMKLLVEMRSRADHWERAKFDRLINALLAERGALIPPFLQETKDAAKKRDQDERWCDYLMHDTRSANVDGVIEHLRAIAGSVDGVSELLRAVGTRGVDLSDTTFIHLANTLKLAGQDLYCAVEAVGYWGDWAKDARKHAAAIDAAGGADTNVAKAIRKHRQADAEAQATANAKERKASRRYLMTMIKQQAAADAKAGRSPAAKARRPRTTKRKAVR